MATSTVSRAFSNPNRVNARTRDRILAVAAELGYRPNPHARALPSGRSRTVAMVVSDITNPHYFELIRGAEQRAKASEYTLVLVNAEESPRIEYDQIQRLVPSVDGFVLAASRLPDENLQQVAAQRPVVLMNRELPGLPSVVLDHEQGCRQIVEHLASLGHRHLVYLAGPRNSWMAKTRWHALRTAAADLGVRADRVGPFTPRVSQGGAAADGAPAHRRHRDRRPQRPAGDRRRPAPGATVGARARRRERGRLRRHLRRRPVHAPAHHPGRRARRGGPRSGRDPARRRRPGRQPRSTPAQVVLPSELVLRSSTSTAPAAQRV